MEHELSGCRSPPPPPPPRFLFYHVHMLLPDPKAHELGSRPVGWLFWWPKCEEEGMMHPLGMVGSNVLPGGWALVGLGHGGRVGSVWFGPGQNSSTTVCLQPSFVLWSLCRSLQTSAEPRNTSRSRPGLRRHLTQHLPLPHVGNLSPRDEKGWAQRTQQLCPSGYTWRMPRVSSHM